ncbi:S-adenosyl-L-methionine-dependent methyltransferase [Mollisia scopiformis]|uniref:S-adenosyl-L-methionine-dependent methyltransferase n=1 Tax=Mollisia scopiformis TaxID=149040 RepID=A0A194WSQ5_MOLSC|nr:S-adenosyl-L-methionine-dependent methyltransferase [Mollisia scopiformis]KUJ10976.1 S-adenosyl-L-methionine-dependent methyltransferase [Mollisia scopiformis]
MSSKPSEKPGFAAPNFSWADYIKHRPIYPSSYYDRIYRYHSEHSNTWDVAHDVGTGPGIIAQELANKFTHVVVSDPNDTYVDIACDRLTNEFGFPKSKFTFLQESAEKSSVEDGTVDLLIIAQAMHWADVEKAMKSFARQVKSGGTLAISFYGRAQLSNNPKAQAALDKVYDVWTDKLIEGGGFAARAMRATDSAFDIVPFSTEDWEPGVKRTLINTGGKKEPMAMSVKNKASYESKVGKDDVFEAEKDDNWTEVRDLKWLKEFFVTLLYNIPEEQVKRFWDEVEEAIGGLDIPVDIFYPAVQLLATRK